jgi:hypothetical protein
MISQGNRAEISNQIHASSAVGESYNMLRLIRLLNTEHNTCFAYSLLTIKLYLQSLKIQSLCRKTDRENAKKVPYLRSGVQLFTIVSFPAVTKDN